MRLLLDEHFSPEIARQLLSRGHDVVAVKGDQDLEGLSDDRLLDEAARTRRSIVTEDATDYMALHASYLRAGRDHYGIIFTSRRSFPRNRRAIGKLVRALDDFLKDNVGEKDLLGAVHWLKPQGR